MGSINRGTISARQELWLIGPGHVTVPLMADWYYNHEDPYAVTMSLDTGMGEPADWTFARDLLAGALHAPEGTGDVRAWPSPAPTGTGAGTEKSINIELESPDGCALFEADAAGIEAFLARTFELVPAGEESDYLNIDTELIEFLGQA